MKNTKALLLAAALAASTLLTACGGGTSSSSAAASTPAASTGGTEPTSQSVKLVVGATAAPHAQILEQVKDSLAAEGIELEIREFSQYELLNPAVADGSLDANYFQHGPYLEDYNVNNNETLVSAAGIHVEPMGIYAGKSDSLDAIPEGALVGIPGDSSNGQRALLLLESLGLIKLDPAAGLTPEVVDIVENPHKLDIRELAADQLPASLPDLDYAVINGNYAIASGVNDKVLANEGADSPYVNVVAVRAGDETRPEILALVAALQSEEVRSFIEATYGGEVLAVF